MYNDLNGLKFFTLLKLQINLIEQITQTSDRLITYMIFASKNNITYNS